MELCHTDIVGSLIYIYIHMIYCHMSKTPILPGPLHTYRPFVCNECAPSYPLLLRSYLYVSHTTTPYHLPYLPSNAATLFAPKQGGNGAWPDNLPQGDTVTGYKVMQRQCTGVYDSLTTRLCPATQEQRQGWGSHRLPQNTGLAVQAA